MTTFAEPLSQLLAAAVDERDYSDVVFLVGVEETPVYASKCILMARSPVFAAQFKGGFSDSRISSSTTTSSSTSTTSPPPLHQVPLLDIEPETFRRLLYCCYTDGLPSDLLGRARPRELVSLYAAADRFLLDHCKTLIKSELAGAINSSNLLSVFDQALAVAPDLAHRLCLPYICCTAAKLLGGEYRDAEAQWLAMSTAGAAAVVASNLAGIQEVDVFRAVERWHLHLPISDDHEAEEQGSARKAVKRRRSVKQATEQVAQVLQGVQYLLMSADEIRDVVEKSGLLSDRELLAIYRESSLYHRMLGVDPPLDCGNKVVLLAMVPHHRGKLAWTAKVAFSEDKYVVYFSTRPQPGTNTRPSEVSQEGISLKLYFDRQCVDSALIKGRGHAPKSPVTVLEGDMDAATLYGPKRVLLLVHVPATALI